MIYHICLETEWKAAEKDGAYVHASIAEEGFIHASTDEQLMATAGRYYRGIEGLVILCIDEGKVSPEVKWEEASNGEDFPHIYGPLNVDAVTKIIPFPVRNDGGFDEPASLV